MSYIRFLQLEKKFENVRAVAGISFDIKKGDFVTFLGPSGCGKTTTLRCLSGLETPEGGEIRIGEKIIFSKVLPQLLLSALFCRLPLVVVRVVQHNDDSALPHPRPLDPNSRENLRRVHLWSMDPVRFPHLVPVFTLLLKIGRAHV